MKQRIESTSWMEYKVKKKKIPRQSNKKEKTKKEQRGVKGGAGQCER